MALTSIKQTINKSGHLFKETSWEHVIKFFEAISENSIPLQARLYFYKRNYFTIYHFCKTLLLFVVFLLKIYVFHILVDGGSKPRFEFSKELFGFD